MYFVTLFIHFSHFVIELAFNSLLVAANLIFCLYMNEHQSEKGKFSSCSQWKRVNYVSVSLAFNGTICLLAKRFGEEQKSKVLTKAYFKNAWLLLLLLTNFSFETLLRILLKVSFHTSGIALTILRASCAFQKIDIFEEKNRAKSFPPKFLIQINFLTWRLLKFDNKKDMRKSLTSKTYISIGRFFVERSLHKFQRWKSF